MTFASERHFMPVGALPQSFKARTGGPATHSDMRGSLFKGGRQVCRRHLSLQFGPSLPKNEPVPDLGTAQQGD